MAVAVVGIASKLLEHTVSMTEGILRNQGCKPRRLPASSVDKPSAQNPEVVLVADEASIGLWPRLSTTAVFITVLPSPAQAAKRMMVEGRVNVAEAVRRVSRACSAISMLRAVPGAVLVDESTVRSRRPALAEMLASRVGALAAGGDRFPVGAGIAAELASVAAALSSIPTEAEGVGSVDEATVHLALDPFEDCLRRDPEGEVTWLRYLFTDAQTGAPASRPIELTGPIRCLIFGPYLYLPAGKWAARIVLESSSSAAGASLLAEVTSGETTLGRAHFTAPPAGGLFEIGLPFRHGDAASPLEVRLFNERSAFDGLLALSSVNLSLAGPLEPQ